MTKTDKEIGNKNLEGTIERELADLSVRTAELEIGAFKCLPRIDTILNLKYGNKSRQFRVNRHTLSSHSQAYFKHFFFVDNKKQRTSSNDQESELEMFNIEERDDLNLGAFRNMLDFVHLETSTSETRKSGTIQQDFLEEFEANELLDMLELSVKYKLLKVVHCAEQNLIERGPGTMGQLVVADAQNLPVLKKHCLETIDVLEYGKNFMENIPLLSKLGQETLKLLDKRIKETAQRYSLKRELLEEEDGDNRENTDESEDIDNREDAAGELADNRENTDENENTDNREDTDESEDADEREREVDSEWAAMADWDGIKFDD